MNFFEKYNWAEILAAHPAENCEIAEYHKILCPPDDYPDFLDKYIALPIMQRLKGVGLLCGTDWTPLYRNRFFYSRLEHSIAVALIVWHFTHSKAQSLAGLFHDVSTPVFSHAQDFRKGDAFTQTTTEAPTSAILRKSRELSALLAADGLDVSQVEDYHAYPVADNEIPRLSADRLEYMFPSGLVFDGSWTLQEIRRVYDDIAVLKNEDDEPELGFLTQDAAELYCERFCMISHILQLNENKLTLQMLAQITSLAEKTGILQEDDFMRLSEAQIIRRLEDFCDCQTAAEKSCGTADEKYLARLFRTFRQMTKIEHKNSPLADDEYFNVCVKVKQRYINPLVALPHKTARLSEISQKSAKIIADFLAYNDTPYGCVKLI